jgi:hypothetical protein
MIRITPPPLNLPKKETKYPLERTSIGSQCRPGRYGEEKNLAPAQNGTPVFQPATHHYVDWANSALKILETNTKYKYQQIYMNVS